jgi:uncharacterized damage-inducible protein DinB
MELSTACSDILRQLLTVVEKIDDLDYRKPSLTLSGSTVGQHLRHTLEFFVCFENGMKSGTVNYDKRAHDTEIETSKAAALDRIRQTVTFIDGLTQDKSLQLEVSYRIDNSPPEVLVTSSSRELVYNIEHAVHHMALIKIGLREVAPYVALPQNFGVAASTVRHHEQAVQSR